MAHKLNSISSAEPPNDARYTSVSSSFRCLPQNQVEKTCHNVFTRTKQTKHAPAYGHHVGDKDLAPTPRRRGRAPHALPTAAAAFTIIDPPTRNHSIRNPQQAADVVGKFGLHMSNVHNTLQLWRLFQRRVLGQCVDKRPMIRCLDAHQRLCQRVSVSTRIKRNNISVRESPTNKQ
jgi:hypothetical protein